MKNIDAFTQESYYVNFSSINIILKGKEIFNGITNDTQKAKIAFEFVRDKIPHTFDISTDVVTAKASDVLENKTGICHAKANLLAALLRAEGIKVGFCFQHITLAEDDSLGYCVHCYNAIYVQGKWIKVDARGNTKGKNAQFSLTKPMLAYSNRPQYDEYFWPGIYANPHMDTMAMLEKSKSIQDIIDNIPDYVTEIPDID